MNSDLTQGVSRRSFMRLLGAASAATTSLPAFAAMQQAGRPQPHNLRSVVCAGCRISRRIR